MMRVLLGVQPDVPTEINETGGRQSSTPYAFHFLPPHALFAAAEVLYKLYRVHSKRFVVLRMVL